MGIPTEHLTSRHSGETLSRAGVPSGALQEIAALLAVSCLLPFLIHLLPPFGDQNWGARLLPIYYAPLFAALCYSLPVTALLCLLAPWVNLFVTGKPPPPIALLLMVETTVFALSVRGLRHRLGLRPWLALPGYLASRMAALILVVLLPPLLPGAGAAPWAWTLQGTVQAWPGVLVLLLINGVVVLYQPPPPGSHPA